MRYRNWLLILPGLGLTYWFVLSFGPLLNMIPWLIMSEDRSGLIQTFSILGLTLWAVMEIVMYVTGQRAPVCPCGYRMEGIPCPECGTPLGQQPSTKTPTGGKTSGPGGSSES